MGWYMQFFGYKHLPEHLQKTSKNFHDLATLMIRHLPDNQQSARAMEHLLEAKDCAVRSTLVKSDG